MNSKVKITLNAVGDIMLAGKVGDKIAVQGADYLFDNVRTILSQADFTIGNLECSLSDRGDPYIQKDFLFSAPPKSATSLRKAGFNILCLANNHILDYGPLAFDDTISALDEAGIFYVGAGENLHEACRPLILQKKQLKIAFLAFTYAYPGKRNRAGCCPCDLRFMQKRISLIKSNVDLVIASIHNGVEYVDYPNRHIISLFRGAVDAGADVVLGHHPHVVQGLETYKDSLVAYSLGNFISDFPDKQVRKEAYQKTALAYFTEHPLDINDMKTTKSFILQCVLSSTGIDNYELIPVKAQNDFQPVVMANRESHDFLSTINKISEKLLHLDDPLFDEMDELLIKSRTLLLENLHFKEVLKKIAYFRFRHIKFLIPFLKAKYSKRTGKLQES